MNPETRHDFRLNFMTNRNEILSLNIPRANRHVEPAQVSAAMLAIIESGVVYSVRGEPQHRYSAELLTTERRDFDVL